jgi:two-component system chemotaxis response regulator CheB
MRDRIIVIGASLNGISALMKLVSQLPGDFGAPILISQHIAAHSPGALPHLLSQAGPLPAIHPKDGEELHQGCIYVAPPDRHMLVERGRIRLSHGPKENLARPAIDPLFRTAALSYGPAVVGIVLTGQLDDGTAGLLDIKDRGGVAIVQEPAEASAPSMPRSALRHVTVDHRCTLNEMPRLLVDLVADPPAGGAPVTRLMEIESRIAFGASSAQDWLELEGMSTPSGFTCPDCRSVLYELPDGRLLRFRCRAGHGFSGESLMSGQADARENLLSEIFGAVIGEVTLARRLAALTEYSTDPSWAHYLTERGDRLQLQADEIRGWLGTMAGLVEAEPPVDSSG